jgi:hypothetical protein
MALRLPENWVLKVLHNLSMSSDSVKAAIQGPVLIVLHTLHLNSHGIMTSSKMKPYLRTL